MIETLEQLTGSVVGIVWGLSAAIYNHAWTSAIFHRWILHLQYE